MVRQEIVVLYMRVRFPHGTPFQWPSGKAGVCKTLIRWFDSNLKLSFQNRLTGRTPPFEGVYLGSNPSSGIVRVAQWKRQ